MSKASYRLGEDICQSYQIFIFTSRGHLGIQYKTQNNRIGSERETGTDGDREKRLMATEHVGKSPASQPMGEWDGRPERGVAKHFLKQLRWGGLTIQMLQGCRCTSFLQWCCGNARPALQGLGSFFKTLMSELPYALTILLLSVYLKGMKTYTIHTDRERNTHTHRYAHIYIGTQTQIHRHTQTHSDTDTHT